MDTDDLLHYIAGHKDSIARTPLMFGGLDGIESAWFTLWAVESFARSEEPTLRRQAYATVASQHKCGSWTLSTKIHHELGETADAANELVFRLRNVDELWSQLREERNEP